MDNIVTHIGVYILHNMDIIYKLWTLTVPFIDTGYVTANRTHAWDILQLIQSTHWYNLLVRFDSNGCIRLISPKPEHA
jgi:hypothetical protein